VILDITKKGAEGGEGEGFEFFFRAPDEDSQKQPFRLPEPNQSEGSGFFVRPDGYIITNYHVIEGAAKIMVKLKDGRRFQAKVVGTDSHSDIAVVKIETKEVPTAEFANSDAVRIGQRVCAIGIPYRLDYSFTVGTVSGKGRSQLIPGTTYEDYIQTDAFINPGNSGGPLFDVDGKVIGMNTLINGIGRGLAFAIPSNMLKEVSDQLIATGKIAHPWLGIRIKTLGEDALGDDAALLGVDKGVVVTTIEADTPAANSNLRPADVITAVDGVPVSADHELQKQILTKKIGQVVNLTVWRNGKSFTLPITAGKLPSSTEDSRGAAQEGKEEEAAPQQPEVYGLRLEDVTKEAADRLGLKQSTGALVIEVEPESPAAVAGIKPNDLITEIDSKPVADAASSRKLLQAHDSQKAVLLFLERKGQKTYAVVKIEK
jgi:S1-C subfamily serine protease